MEGFLFENAGEALKFFERCEEVGATTYAERTAVLRQMVKEKKATYVRDPDSLIKTKKVVKFKKEGL